jgi:hypothetical protein
MTYNNQFVAEVKSNGRILRVKDGSVYLPFGSEYTILLKNLNSRRAAINISIDGEDALDNSSLILEANSSTEIEGFLRGNVARNRFRFINKTKQISDHRGDKADDGLIRIEFAFEKPKPEPWIKETIKEIHHYGSPINYTYYNTPDWNTCRSLGDNKQYTSSAGNDDEPVMTSSGPPVTRNMTDLSSNVTMDSLGVQNISNVPNVDEGITVKGSECNQQFRYASIGDLEDPNTIVIQLKGLAESGSKVSQPVTVERKLICSSCGVKSKSSFKFCPNCGTFLE